jgi:hypothetical protein
MIVSNQCRLSLIFNNSWLQTNWIKESCPLFASGIGTDEGVHARHVFIYANFSDIAGELFFALLPSEMMEFTDVQSNFLVLKDLACFFLITFFKDSFSHFLVILN